MSSVQERSRRATAGKRMTSLVGQALEDDSAFWGHETWQSDEESFKSEAESLRDEFDTDFDDSESDGEIDEVQEKELLRQDKELMRQETSRVIASGSGNSSFGGNRKQRLPKRVVGQEQNAGLVLNLPATFGGSSSALPPVAIQSQQQQQQIQQQIQSQPVAVASAAVPVQAIPRSRSNHHKTAEPALAATRSRRAGGFSKYSSRYRAARSDAHIATTDASSNVSNNININNSHSNNNNNTSNQQSTKRSTAGSKKRKRQRYSQQDLILEAVRETEPENKRWQLARKRMQQESEAIKEATSASTSNIATGGGKVIEHFVSRRGYPNTVHFPEMDHLPRILQSSSAAASSKHGAATAKSPQPERCIISGKPAKYKDPLTGYGYHDVAAFKELRRRFEKSNGSAAELESTVHGNGEASTEDVEMTDSTADQPDTVKSGKSRKGVAKRSTKKVNKTTKTTSAASSIDGSDSKSVETKPTTAVSEPVNVMSLADGIVRASPQGTINKSKSTIVNGISIASDNDTQNETTTKTVSTTGDTLPLVTSAATNASTTSKHLFCIKNANPPQSSSVATFAGDNALSQQDEDGNAAMEE